MKRAEIQHVVDLHLRSLGFHAHSWAWRPGGLLLLVVGDELKRLQFRSGISKRNLFYGLGKMDGWAEGIGIKPQPNGSAGNHKTRDERADLDMAQASLCS